MDAFDAAWSVLKALDEQQMALPTGVHTEGYPRLGHHTMHPAIQGLLNRIDTYPDSYGYELGPNTGYNLGEEFVIEDTEGFQAPVNYAVPTRLSATDNENKGQEHAHILTPKGHGMASNPLGGTYHETKPTRTRAIYPSELRSRKNPRGIDLRPVPFDRRHGVASLVQRGDPKRMFFTDEPGFRLMQRDLFGGILGKKPRGFYENPSTGKRWNPDYDRITSDYFDGVIR